MITTQSALILTQTDFEKLSSLVAAAQPSVAELLEEELGRATVVPSEELPNDVVAMNSKVSFKDLDTGKESTITLVYPNEADIDEGKVSVFAPVGLALIGLRVGQVINWPLPHGKQKKIKVIESIQDPR